MEIESIFLQLRRIVRSQGKYVMKKLFDYFLTGPITKKLVPSCIICGSEKQITKEHVLPKWVFESQSKHSFTSDVNQLAQTYIGATLPACKICNSELLNSIERYIQKTLTRVDLQTTFYDEDEYENIIRWLEIVDYKFQVWDVSTKFRAHKTAGYVPFLADVSIAFMRDMSVGTVTSKTRSSLKRIATSSKLDRSNELVFGRTIEKSFHYFHTSGQFMHLEIPKYNKGFFYFYEKTHKNYSATLREAKRIIKTVYNV